MLLYVSMVAAGVMVHYAFSAAGILPDARPGLQEMVAFQVDYTFWLNHVFVGVAGVLLALRRRGSRGAP